MSWDQRKQASSCNAATKRQGRIVRKSDSRRPPAGMAARRAEEARPTRLSQKDALRLEREQLDGPERLLEELDRACTFLMEANLMAAGFHRHNYGPWRRRRHGRDH